MQCRPPLFSGGLFGEKESTPTPFHFLPQMTKRLCFWFHATRGHCFCPGFSRLSLRKTAISS
jgi:hypothetical protein